MKEYRMDRVFNFIITWGLMRMPIIFITCYGLYKDFNSYGLSYFAGITIVMLFIIMDRQLKIKKILGENK